MSISRIKFVILFLILGFSFLFITTSLADPADPRVFPNNRESFLDVESTVAWKTTVFTVLLPVKIVLIGPLVPYIDFLRQEPDTPPPFFVIGFIFYWTLLALVIHYACGTALIRGYIQYLQDNPHGYWFKAKLYGWGWVPVKWQGWLVVLIAMVILAVGIYVGETDDSPGAGGLGILLMLAIIFFFGYWKGEKPRWQWGLPKDKK